MNDTLDTRQQLFLKAMQRMHEDDFSKKIIKPLFEAMGCYRVDFVGGPYEGGKDIIAFFDAPGDLRITYAIQSKKIGDGSGTTDKERISTLILQLHQCYFKGINLHDGTVVIPNQVYLASPYQISIRLVNEIHEMLNIHHNKIIIMDGAEVINKLKKNKPDLLESLLTFEDNINNQDSEELKNLELITALNQKTAIQEINCYSDLGFFIGSVDSNILLNSEFGFTKEVAHFTRGEWDVFERQVYSPLKATLQFDPLSLSKEELLSKYNKETKAFQSKENNDIKKNINQATQLLNGNIEYMRSVFSEIEGNVKTMMKSNIKNQYFHTISMSANYLKQCIETNFDINAVTAYRNFISEKEIDKLSLEHKQSVFTKITESSKKIKSLHSQQFELFKLKQEYIEEPKINVKFRSDEIVEWLTQRSKKYKKDIMLIDTDSLSLDIANFLEVTQSTLNALDILVNKIEDSSRYFTISKRDGRATDGLSISPFKIFDSRYNIAIYGGAGAGKTTTLQMYAKKLIESGVRDIIYLPLNRYIDKVDFNLDSKTKDYDALLSFILISRSIVPTRENIISLVGYLNRTPKIKLIFDGLDEAYAKYPGIVSAINAFKTKHQTIQLLISSRDCVSFLPDINFLGITLLPFTELQLYKFIDAWFSEKDKSLGAQIIESIKKKGIVEIFTTPLLATLLCDLAEKGVDIPSSESEVFTKRLELLCGTYDAFKKIKRTELSQSILMRSAMKIAFALHSKGIRSASKDELINFLIYSNSFQYEKKTCIQAVTELIEACNILILEPIPETYSFGHLRYQEHLVSLEMAQNRSIELIHYLKSDWWRGALCLYAQSFEFSSLIEKYTIEYLNIEPALITLEAMAKSRPQKEQIYLAELLKNYEKTDDNYFEDYHEWNDEWRPGNY